LEPFPRSWSHFLAISKQKLTNLVKIDFEIPHEGPCVVLYQGEKDEDADVGAALDSPRFHVGCVQLDFPARGARQVTGENL